MSVEFAGKNACIAPEGVFIIGTYDENGVPNAMNAAWGAQSDFDEITFFWQSTRQRRTSSIPRLLPWLLLPRTQWKSLTTLAWKPATRSTR